MRVLLVGNTGYITKEFVQEAFPESEVFIMGNSLLKTERKKHLIVRPFPERDEELEDIFHTYDFELMVYFSNYITFHGTMEGEAEKLRKVLSYCKRSKEIHVIYLTGPEAGYAATTGKTLLVRGAENLCCQYGKMYQIPVKIVRIPYLYSGVYKEDYFYKMFAAIRSGEPVEIQESPDQPLQFLNSMDLAELLEKMSDNWDEEYHYLNVPNVFSNTFRELEQKIKEIDASVRIENKGLIPVEKIPPDDKVVRFKYGWFPKISLLEDFSDIYDQYLDSIGEKERRIDRWKIWLDKHRPIVKIVELVIGFFLFEFLNHLAGNQAQFKMIDLRLVFIVLFGSLYGINYGIAAAALETISLLAAYEREGVGWTTLFYEPSNWIPFIFYFAVGAICGYVRMKNKENIKVCLVGSSGGHLTHLYMLKPFWKNKDHFWVTFDKEDARSLLEGEKMYPCYYPTNRSLKALIKNTKIAWNVLHKEKPDLIISCGAAVAVPFFYIGKMMGAKLVYIEVFDRIDKPTMTGKMVYPIVDKFVVQWEEQKKVYPKAVNLGSIF